VLGAYGDRRYASSWQAAEESPCHKAAEDFSSDQGANEDAMSQHCNRVRDKEPAEKTGGDWCAGLFGGLPDYPPRAKWRNGSTRFCTIQISGRSGSAKPLIFRVE